MKKKEEMKKKQNGSTVPQMKSRDVKHGDVEQGGKGKLLLHHE